MGLSRTARDAGYKALAQPSPHTAAILRRIARGYLMVTHGNDDKGRPQTLYHYDDGVVVRDANGKPLQPRAVTHMAREHWIIPIKGETLFEDGSPQRYRARTLDDGLLPKWVKK